jgi:NAD(P)-dependent dehydrogenase (short-subunit alcohol dehydrogenase family)
MRIVVTGAGGALGGAVTRRLESAGEVIPADIETVDLKDFLATRMWADSVGAPVHSLVALAGGFGMKKIDQMDFEHYTSMFGLNIQTAMSTLAAFDRFLADGASVILMGSQAYQGAAGMSAYAASKAAVISLAKSAAAEWKSRGIRVNALLPDIIDTPSNRDAMPKANFDHWQKPAEIAEVIAFMLGENSRNISGNAINLGRVHE